MLTSAPPELPGLIAASVWMASSTVFWFRASPPAATGRFRALMMPVVTVPSSPSGEPIATTSWPTCRLAEEPSVIGVRPETPCALTTAISLLGSAPTTVNRAVRPSAKVTVVSGPPLAAATTWLLVKISPSDERMIPEPSSVCRPMSVSSLTTLGTTLAATCSTEPAGRLAAGTLGAAPGMIELLAAGRSGCTSIATPPPMPAETIATASAPAVKAPARERFCGTPCRAAGTGAGCGRYGS